MKVERVITLKKNVEKFVKQNKMDLALLELENVYDLMNDFHFNDGWVLCKLCLKISNSISTELLERNEITKIIKILRFSDKITTLWKKRLEFANKNKTIDKTDNVKNLTIHQGKWDDYYEMEIIKLLNYADYNKKMNKNVKSNDCLVQALKFCSKLSNIGIANKKLKVKTYLTISSSYYELKKYLTSIEYSIVCIEAIKEELKEYINEDQQTHTMNGINYFLEEFGLANFNVNYLNNDSIEKFVFNDDEIYELFNTIGMIYLNIGIAYESLMDFENTYHYYEKTYYFTKIYLEEYNQLSVQIKEIYYDYVKNYEKIKYALKSSLLNQKRHTSPTRMSSPSPFKERSMNIYSDEKDKSKEVSLIRPQTAILQSYKKHQKLEGIKKKYSTISKKIFEKCKKSSTVSLADISKSDYHWVEKYNNEGVKVLTKEIKPRQLSLMNDITTISSCLTRIKTENAKRWNNNLNLISSVEDQIFSTYQNHQGDKNIDFKREVSMKSLKYTYNKSVNKTVDISSQSEIEIDKEDDVKKGKSQSPKGKGSKNDVSRKVTIKGDLEQILK